MYSRFLIFPFILGLLAACSQAATPTLETSTPIPPTAISTLAPTGTFTPAPQGSTAYYRVRIQYETSSDWTTLDLLTPDHVLAMRIMAVDGQPTNHQAGVRQLALSQPLVRAEAGTKVSMSVDYALEPEVLDQPLQFRVQKGDIGVSAVKIFNVTSGIPESIFSVDYTGVVNNSSGLNPKEFSVDLTALKKSMPLVSNGKASHLPKMVLAFYYSWYTMNDWTSNWLRDTPLIRYSSGDVQTITRQVDEAQSAGIDGFISSWWGPGSDTDKNLRKLLTVAQAKNFKVSIYFETLAGPNESPLEAAQIQTWLAYAINSYGTDPAFIRVDSKPLIIIWASATVPLETWKTVFANLRAQGLDAVYLAMGYDLTNLDVFDGLHDYGIFTYPNLAQTYQVTSKAVRNYSLLSDQPTRKIWAATVQPGYDDRNIPGRQGLVQDRQNGDFYRATWETAMQSDPDWIFITTWNEWWEHTYIEPSKLYGDQYLKITQQYADEWKIK